MAHHELVDCLRFIIIVCSVPAGDADAEDPTSCRLTPFALSTVTSRYMCISIGMGGTAQEVRVKKRFDKYNRMGYKGIINRKTKG